MILTKTLVGSAVLMAPCSYVYLWHGQTEDLLVVLWGRRVDTGDLLPIDGPQVQVRTRAGRNVTLSHRKQKNMCEYFDSEECSNFWVCFSF